MIPLALLFGVTPDRAPRPPQASAFGRAATVLAHEGVQVVIGQTVDDVGTFHGQAVLGERWVDVAVRPSAVVHRFPDHTQPEAFARLHARLGHLPWVNPQAVVQLCRDKHATLDWLVGGGITQCPEQVPVDRSRMLDHWGAGFLKPRFGAFGEGVRRVVAGDPLPRGDGWVLQRAVPAPEGWAGWSCRVLCQREVAHSWVARQAVLRRHRTDPVVNVARDADVVPAIDHLPADTHDAMVALALAACARIEAAHPLGPTGELGVDVVIDRDLQPWLIEVNGKPRGRLEVLARAEPERFAPAQQQAALAPLRLAAHLAGGSRTV